MSVVQIREARVPAGVDAVFDIDGADTKRAELLTSYIDAWAWMDQNTLPEVLKLVADNTIFNNDFGALLHRWFTGASLLVEPCLQFERNRHLMHILKTHNCETTFICRI